MSHDCEQGICKEMLALREEVSRLVTDVKILKSTWALSWKWGLGVASGLATTIVIAHAVLDMLGWL